MFYFWLACCIFLICFYFLGSIAIITFKSSIEEKEKFNFPVSVIVCFHNEENNIYNLLEALLSQNYFKFEIILVDDRSSDKTPFLLWVLSNIWVAKKFFTRICFKRFFNIYQKNS